MYGKPLWLRKGVLQLIYDDDNNHHDNNHKACGTSTDRHQVKAATMDATIMWMRVPHAGGKPMADSLVKSKSANLKQSS